MSSRDISFAETASVNEEDTTPRLSDLLAAGDREALTAFLKALPTDELRRGMSQLSEEEQQEVVQLLNPEDAADVIDDLPDEHAADVLEDIPPEQAAAIIEELDSDDRADVLAEMETEEVEAILKALPAEDADETRQLLSYPSDTAGGVMVTEFIAYPIKTTVDKILDDLRRNREGYSYYNQQYFYVLDEAGVLKGVLRLRDVVLSPASQLVEQVMISDPTVVRANVDLDTLQHLFEVHTYSALPVVDEAGRLLGVVTEKEAAEAARKSANRTIMKLAGIFGGEELRSMPLLSRVWGRLSWLLVIMFLTVCAASVIHLFENTLRSMITLAVFLPVVSGMSGCSGNQALGLTLRELTLGIVRPTDVLYVLLKEIRVGVINGLTLGTVLGVVGYLWNGNVMLGVVVGLALALGTVMAVCLGGTVPLLLKRLRLDPATGSGPILTTVADMAGFFFVLGLATLAMYYLGFGSSGG